MLKIDRVLDELAIDRGIKLTSMADFDVRKKVSLILEDTDITAQFRLIGNKTNIEEYEKNRKSYTRARS